MTILNETAIDSGTLNPIIRRQVYQHAGPEASADLLVRVYHGRHKRTAIRGYVRRTRGHIAIVIPPRLFVTAQDWRQHAPALAQCIAIAAARWSGRHARLERTHKFQAAPAEVAEFAAAADHPFGLRPKTSLLPMEARLEYVILQRRRLAVMVKHYQRYRNWEKQLRFRLRKLGSHV